MKRQNGARGAQGKGVGGGGEKNQFMHSYILTRF